MRALALVVLKRHITIFSTINTKKPVAMVEEKPKNLVVEHTVAKMVKKKLLKVILFYCVGGGGCCLLL